VGFFGDKYSPTRNPIHKPGYFSTYRGRERNVDISSESEALNKSAYPNAGKGTKGYVSSFVGRVPHSGQRPEENPLGVHLENGRRRNFEGRAFHTIPTPSLASGVIITIYFTENVK